MLKLRKYPPNGFTLIELLVVVLIIGILAAIALPQYRRVVMQSKFATLKDKTRVIYEAEQRYYLVNGAYTTNWEDLDIESVSSNCHIYAPDTYVYCEIIRGGEYLQYVIMSQTQKRRCDSCPADETSLSSQICQMDTGDANPNCNGSCCTYYY